LISAFRASLSRDFSVADPSSSVRAWDHLNEAVPAGTWFTIPLGPGAIANLTVEDESD
jgi:hypothetical protein